MSYSVVLSWR